MMPGKKRDDHLSQPEGRLATELPPIDCGDLVERSLHRAWREGLEEATAGEPELLLRDLPLDTVPPGLVERSLATVDFVHLRRWLRTGGERSPRTRRRIMASAVLAGTVALLVFLLRPAPPPALPAGPDGLAVVIHSLSGRVDIARQGRVEAALEGRALRDGDVLGTADDGHAVVVIGVHGRLVMDPFSRIRLVRTNARIPTFDVLQGRAEGHLQGPDARAAPFRFGLAKKQFGLVRGRVGVVRVAEDRYLLAAMTEAVVETDQEQITLPPAHALRISPDETSAAVAWPREVALSLHQDQPIDPDGRQVVIAGQTSPEVILIINSVSVPVDHEGRFIATLTITGETTVVEAIARDVLGATHRKQLPLIRAATRVDWREPG